VEALGFKRVLIVEDEPMIAMLLEDMIDEMGAEVAGVASSLDEAQCAALGSDVDVAVLDINLRGQMSYPAAQTLSDRGIPFIFVTGFARDAIPPTLGHVPVLPKPYCLADIAFGLTRALTAPNRARQAVS
jgi:CheY-like chemotaxis protein